MRRSVGLYLQMISISIRSQMQYKSSFLLLSFAHFISTFAEIIGIWVLFERFKFIQGWTLAELSLIYGIIHIGFAIAETSSRGFDTFSSIVKNGEFDRLLLRPCSTLLQVASREFQLMRVGRFLQGLCVLIWGFNQNDLSFVSPATLIIITSILGTSCLFYGLFVLQATLSFWTVETLELMNITTYGGVEAGQYPITAYTPVFRLIFTFIIPLACVAYYPIAVLLKHETLPFWTAFLLPLTGSAFLYLSFKTWSFGVRHYRSAGS